MRRHLSVLSLLLLPVAPVRAEEAPAAEKPALTIGLSRPYGAEAAQKSGEMIEGYLSGALKRRVESRIFDNYDSLGDAVAKGEIDFAWINPLSYVDASKQGAVVPIAKAMRRRSLYYKACLYVRADASYSRVADLKGARALWVDPHSTSGHLFPKAMVLKSGASLSGFFTSEAFAGDHKTACDAVISGRADVSGTYADAEGTAQRPVGCRDELGEEAASKLRCLEVSENIANEVIAGRPGLEEALVGKLTAIFAELSDTASGREILTNVFRADGFGYAEDDDFEPIRKVAKAVAEGKWTGDGKTVDLTTGIKQAPKPAKAAKKAKGAK